MVVSIRWHHWRNVEHDSARVCLYKIMRQLHAHWFTLQRLRLSVDSASYCDQWSLYDVASRPRRLHYITEKEEQCLGELGWMAGRVCSVSMEVPEAQTTPLEDKRSRERSVPCWFKIPHLQMPFPVLQNRKHTASAADGDIDSPSTNIICWQLKHTAQPAIY